MVTTTRAYTESRYLALPGEGFDGVVRVSVAGYYGTGLLLQGGRAVLTSAHLFESVAPFATVVFETAGGTRSLASSQVLIHPGYDPVDGNHDLAIVWLEAAAPADAERYALYRDSDEIGQVMTLVGYGQPGTGQDGADENYPGQPPRMKAKNHFDADIGTLKAAQGGGMGWNPQAGTQLVADFDDGTTERDALGLFIGRNGTGLGNDEGLVAQGDSGGPAFIGNRVAGVLSYTASLSHNGQWPDVDDASNSSFGEIAAWQRVSHYQEWIDRSLREGYADAPKTPDEVAKSVSEGSSGSVTVYFLLQFTGVRKNPDDWLSVDFSTRDGTAKAGEDYLAASGTLILYPGETQATIPVEVLGDARAEPDELFYLDVTNPVGGSFGTGVTRLTAVRTIVDDDGFAG